MERAARATDQHALRITEFVSNLMGAVQVQSVQLNKSTARLSSF